MGELDRRVGVGGMVDIAGKKDPGEAGMTQDGHSDEVAGNSPVSYTHLTLPTKA